MIKQVMPALTPLSEAAFWKSCAAEINDNALGLRLMIPGTEEFSQDIDAALIEKVTEKISRDFARFVKEGFVRICGEYLWRKRFDGTLLMKPRRLSPWCKEQTSIDLVGQDSKEENLLVADCNSGHLKTSFADLKALDKKCEALPIKNSVKVHRYLFSRSGFDDALVELAQTDPMLHLVTLEALFV
ncbi:MAG: DUF234 domain-containing protein [Sutterellaceae bacterium]|nr:DUF234 domain-containing protein [Sutterellaceae bacterium]